MIAAGRYNRSRGRNTFRTQLGDHAHVRRLHVAHEVRGRPASVTSSRFDTTLSDKV